MCDNIHILFHVSKQRDDADWYHLFNREHNEEQLIVKGARQHNLKI